MSLFHAPSSIVLQVAAIAMLGASGLVGAADVPLDAQCQPQLNREQQRIFDKYTAGIDQLRHYLFRRRYGLQLDTYETALWAEGVERQKARCLQALADRATDVAGAQPAGH
jgi:hypothetical protein